MLGFFVVLWFCFGFFLGWGGGLVVLGWLVCLVFLLKLVDTQLCKEIPGFAAIQQQNGLTLLTVIPLGG